MSEQNPCYIYKVQNGCLLLLLNYNEPGKYIHFWGRKLFVQLYERLDVENYHFSISLGTEVENIRDLMKAYETAQIALRCRLGGQYDRLICYVPEFEKCPLEILAGKEFWEEFERRIEILDHAGIGESVKKYFAEMNEKAKQYPFLVYKGTEFLLQKFRDKCQKLNIFSKDSQAHTSIQDWDFAMGDIAGMQRLIREYFEGCLIDCKNKKENAETIPVEKAKEYIAQHLGDVLSLDVVAGYCKLNPIYLSALFKKTTNINFLNYITNVRIDRAKEMLIETDYSIADIAEQVGYIDVKYFSKTFKKNVGLNPQQYRKLHGR